MCYNVCGFMLQYEYKKEPNREERKKMKKRSFGTFLTMCILAGSIMGVSAASGSGYYGGSDGKSISKEWHTGWNVSGDYTQAKASNRGGYTAYMKQVYARSGDDGSYSDWVRSGTNSVTHKDYGPYRTSKYEARFYWDYD